MFRDENNKLKSYDQILERLSHAIKEAYNIDIVDAEYYVIDNFESLLEVYEIKELI